MEALIGGISGYTTPFVLNKMGIKMYHEGVTYYAQVHKSKFNCYVHTILMPLRF